MAHHNSAPLAGSSEKCQLPRAIGCLVAGLAVLAGCNFSGTPQFALGGSEGSRPTVNDLVDHIACEVFQAIKTHTIDPRFVRSYTPELANFNKTATGEQKLWLKLVEYNFVAAVAFQLQVTNTEGINPCVDGPRLARTSYS